MLEIFSSENQVGRYIENPTIVRAFLEDVYLFLVKRNYFKLVRQMLEEKVPPLDEPVLTAPNSISETLLHMILQPLKLINSYTGFSQHILSSFIEYIISPEFSNPIRYFIIPCLANYAEFPFLHFIKFLVQSIYNVDDDTSITNPQNIDATSPTSSQTTTKKHTDLFTSSFLLNAVLKLDQLHLDKINNIEYLGDYIKIIAAISSNLNRLPRKIGTTVFKNEDSSESDDDSGNEKKFIETCSAIEIQILLEIVQMLNEPIRARLIVENAEQYFLDDPDVLHSLCRICHHLMMYHRMAIIEYK